MLKLQKKNADIIFGDTDIVDLSGNFISKRHLSAPEILTKKSFAKGMLVCHQAFMVKKNLAGEYNLDYRFSSDYDWCVRCLDNSNPERCINLKEVTIDFLSAGISDKNKKISLWERFKIMVRHYGMLPTLINHFQFIVRAIRRGRL